MLSSFSTWVRPAGRTVGFKIEDFLCCSKAGLTSKPAPPSFRESCSSISTGVIGPSGASMGSCSPPSSPSPPPPNPSAASSADFRDTAILLGSDLVFILMIGVLLREMAETAVGSPPPSSGASHCCSWLDWSLLGSSGGFAALRFSEGACTSPSSAVETLGSSALPITISSE